MLTAIKEITRIKNHQLTLNIPDDFNYEKVEVLILPFQEAEEVPYTKNDLLRRFQKLQMEVDKVSLDIPPTIDIISLTEDMNDATL